MKKVFVLISSIVFCIASTAHAVAWPATDSVGTDIATQLMHDMPTFEPSGVAWSAYIQAYIVVSDEGDIAAVTTQGDIEQIWSIGNGYDIEDVTVTDETAPFIYLLDENTSSIIEMDLSSGALTGKAWTAQAYITEVDNTSGAEGLTWVPNGIHPYTESRAGGLFYMGWQHDGDIYVFDVDSDSSGEAIFVDEISMTEGYTDLSGLAFNAYTQRVYALYDGVNILEERTPSGELVASYALPSGEDQEGVALVTTSFAQARIVIAEDGAGRVMYYAGYPATTVDQDSDSVAAVDDCNDTDATVSVEQTYYRDEDGDGLGSAVDVVIVCAAQPSEGYVDNASDANDHDADNDGSEGSTWAGEDCDDGQVLLSTEIVYYRDEDGDGLGSPDVSQSACSLNAPTGYVDNDYDTNDAVANAGVEIADDNLDNDADGEVDELNESTIDVPNTHPAYDALDPSTEEAAQVARARGARYGRIIVRYADESEYRYTIFRTTRTYKLKVRTIANTAYAVVKGKKKVAIVNLLNGEVIAKRKRPHNAQKLALWVNTHIGFTE